MYRSWAYILMVLATLVGVVALVWPSPQVRTIEEIAAPAHEPAPKAEAPAKPPKAAAKGGQANKPPKPAPALPPPPPPAVKHMPQPNTTTKRAGAGPRIENGLAPGIAINPNAAVPPLPPGMNPGPWGAGQHPPVPPRAGTATDRPQHEPAAK
jgi:hypothetical protein